MKTFVKVAAIAVITALTVLSCVPEVEITKHDVNAVFDKYDFEYIPNAARPADPTITVGSLQINGTLPQNKELDITFPWEADILRQGYDLAKLETEMKKFLSFHAYTEKYTTTGTPITATPELRLDPDTYTEAAVTDYKVIHRGRDASGADSSSTIKIRLESVPTTQKFIARFNQNYTYGNGIKNNLLPSNVPDALYGDLFFTIQPAAGGTTPTAMANFRPPAHLGWNIQVLAIAGSANYAAAPVPIARRIAVFTDNFNAVGGVTDGYVGNVAADRTAAIIAKRKEVYEAFASKFVFEKWDNDTKKWIAEGSTPAYYDGKAVATATDPLRVTGIAGAADTGAAGTTGAAGACFYVVFTPTDRTAYRVRMTGTDGLETADQYRGFKQKIGVWSTIMGGASFAASTNYYDKKEIVGQLGYWYTYGTGANPLIAIGSTAPARFGSGGNTAGIMAVVPDNGQSVTHDHDGKNVVLRIKMNPITSVAPNSYPAKINDLNEFKKNFKIVYRRGGVAIADMAAVASANDLVFVNIQDAVVQSSEYNANANQDELLITLDPAYNYNGSGVKYILVAPGFKYDNERIFFGDYGNWQVEFDGVKYWAYGGTFPFFF
jgi:hypothetical protein